MFYSKRIFPKTKTRGEGLPVTLLWGALLLFLSVFIVYPLIRVFAEANASSWKRVLAGSLWYKAAGNSLLLVVLSTTLSVTAGLVYAYGVCRGGLPFKRFFSFIPILHLVTPPFVGGLSFILLFGRQGFFTKTLLGLDVSLYGLPGLLIAQTLCFFPLAFLVIKGVFEGMNRSLEYAARDLGAGRLKVFATVTLPLLLPGIVSASLFISISILSDFGNPILIGGRFTVLAVELYSQLTGWAEQGTSAVLGIILLVPAFVLFVLQRIVMGQKSSRFATVGARSQEMPPDPPPLPVRVLLFLFCLFISFIVAAQFISIIGGAFSRLWGIDSTFTLKHLVTASGYTAEMAHTFSFAFTAALMTAALGALLAFFNFRLNLPLRRFADTTVMIPAAIPGSLIGLAFVLAFNNKAFSLSGTGTVIVLAMVVCDLPAAYRIMSSSVQRIRMSLDDSARSLGASPLRLFADVIGPLSAQALASAFIFAFVRSTGTLSAVIFLVSFKTKLASVLILNLAAQGDWGGSAALALILTAAVFGALGVLALVSRALSRGKTKGPALDALSGILP